MSMDADEEAHLNSCACDYISHLYKMLFGVKQE